MKKETRDIVIVECNACKSRYDQERNGHLALWVRCVISDSCPKCNPESARYLETFLKTVPHEIIESTEST